MRALDGRGVAQSAKALEEALETQDVMSVRRAVGALRSSAARESGLAEQPRHHDRTKTPLSRRRAVGKDHASLQDWR